MAQKIMQRDGIAGFYRGFVPNALKNLPNKGAAFQTHFHCYLPQRDLDVVPHKKPPNKALTFCMSPTVICEATAAQHCEKLPVLHSVVCLVLMQ